MLTATWNTNRAYTSRGPLIRAELLADGAILFFDMSRGISGEIAPNQDRPAPATETGLQARVMAAYDHNRYTGTARAWAFAMMLKGY